MPVAPTIAPPFTAESFVAWSEAREADGRHELLDGAIVAMGAERVGHARAKTRLHAMLARQIEDRGLLCEAFPDGMAVRVDETTVFEPDVLVRCGAPLDDDIVLINDPVVVVEVASPSTQRIDVLVKLARYFRNASLVHYLIVLPTARLVVHHRRGADGAIETASYDGSGTVALDPPGLTLDVAALFPPVDARS